MSAEVGSASEPACPRKLARFPSDAWRACRRRATGPAKRVGAPAARERPTAAAWRRSRPLGFFPGILGILRWHEGPLQGGPLFRGRPCPQTDSHLGQFVAGTSWRCRHDRAARRRPQGSRRRKVPPRQPLRCRQRSLELLDGWLRSSQLGRQEPSDEAIGGAVAAPVPKEPLQPPAPRRDARAIPRCRPRCP